MINNNRKSTSDEENTIVYRSSIFKVNPFFTQKSFKILPDDVNIISIRKGVFFDEDYLVLILMANNNDRYFIPYVNLNNEIKIILYNYFDIAIESELKKIRKYYEDETFDYILFPDKFYGKRFFKKPNIFQMPIMFLKKILFIKNYADGFINPLIDDNKCIRK